jgi:hypothetical protein
MQIVYNFLIILKIFFWENFPKIPKIHQNKHSFQKFFLGKFFSLSTVLTPFQESCIVVLHNNNNNNNNMMHNNNNHTITTTFLINDPTLFGIGVFFLLIAIFIIIMVRKE